MESGKGLQLVIAHTLRAEADAVYTHFAVLFKLTESDGGGIGFYCRFGVDEHLKIAVNAVHELKHELFGHDAGSTSAYVYGIHREGGCRRGIVLHLQKHGVDVTAVIVVIGHRIKVTVRALAFAKGHVQVKSECFHICVPFCVTVPRQA